RGSAGAVARLGTDPGGDGAGCESRARRVVRIVEMSRVLVLGPKRLLGQVIDEVQRLGTLHIDRTESEETPEVTALQLGEEDAKTLQALERALARVDGLLALLPPGSAEPGDAPGDAVDALDAEVAEIERKVRDLTRKRLELDEERQLI